MHRVDTVRGDIIMSTRLKYIRCKRKETMNDLKESTKF